MSVFSRRKLIVKKALLGSRVLELVSRLREYRCVILRYHSIQPDVRRCLRTVGVGITHCLAAFEAQMSYIKQRFTLFPLAVVYGALAGKSPLPNRAVAVTFDDGYRDNYTVAAPILDSYGIKAAFFVTVGSIESGRLPWFCRLRRSFHCTAKREWVETVSQQAWELSREDRRMEAFCSACRICATLTGEEQDDM